MSGGFGGGANLAALLRNAEVVKLLNITEAQTAELGTALAPQRPAAGTNAGQPQTAAERRVQTDAQWASVAKVLNAEQLKKFKDIYFQANVPVANPNAAAGAPAQVMSLNVYVLGAVDLTADQKTKINKILDDAAAATTAATRPAAGATQEERAAFMTAFTERNTKTNEAIKALLTDAQKKKIDELTAGAAKVRTDMNLGQQGGRGAGAGAGGAAPGGRQPGAGGAGAGAGGAGGRGAGGAGGGFPRGGAQQAVPL
jgi:hypothetical protein